MDSVIYFTGTIDMVPITKRGIVIAWSLVDKEDLPKCLELTWHLHPKGYAWNGNTLLHRFIMNAPKGKLVDHIHHSKLDNRKAELRLCETWQNCANRQGPPADNRSGLLGVFWVPGRRKHWKAQEVDGCQVQEARRRRSKCVRQTTQ